jgi:glycosidase
MRIARAATWGAALALLGLAVGCDWGIDPIEPDGGRVDGRVPPGMDGGMLDGWVDPFDGGPPPPADGGPAGLCPVELSYLAPSGVSSVHVAGSFNAWSTSTDALANDGAGTYRGTLWLAPGLYPYKLYAEGDGLDPWRLDPDNPYRAYDSGIENSGLRVDDCFAPRLVVQSASGTRSSAGAGRVEAVLRYDARRATALGTVTAELRSGGAARPLTASELTVTETRVDIAISGLADGKHTVRVVAADDRGVESEAVVLPVWIEETAFDWRDVLVYMVMTDRFQNGDDTNDGAATGASLGAEWSGGDLEGVTQAIRDGYLDSLGVRAIWLTPFNTNPAGAYAAADGVHQVAGYHGYWPTEPREVDPRLGGEAALDELVTVAHEHGIRILMDLVLNHVHEDHPYYRDHPDWFNSGCICGTGGCDWTERRLDCLFRDYMPDVDWTSPEASEQFIADALYWLERFDLDGFRVDAVKHVVDGAVFNLGVRVRERFETAGTRYFLMGETAQGWDSSAGPREGGNVDNYGIISRYITPYGLDGQFDFVLYYAASLQFLGDAPGRGMIHVDYWTRASAEEYPAGAIMTPYIGSHDTSRFLTLTAHPAQANNQWSDLPPEPTTDEPFDRMYVALAWMLAIPGAPLLYYGDEYGEHGGDDPDNRHAWVPPAERTARQTALHARIARLGQLRKQVPALRRGDYVPLTVTEDVLSFARTYQGESAVVVINRAGATRQIQIALPGDLAAAPVVVDRLDPGGRTLPVTGGAITVDMAGRSAAVLTR